MPKLNDIRRGMDIGQRGSFNNFIWLACPQCGEERWVVRYRTKGPKYTGLCHSCNCKVGSQYCRKGKDHWMWRGGRHYSNGYVLVLLEKDDFFYPMTQKLNHNIMEHRLVMAKHLGRCLEPWEVVHHKNHIKDDNRLENLELLPNQSFHVVDTRTKTYIRELEERIKKLETDILEGKR